MENPPQSSIRCWQKPAICLALAVTTLAVFGQTACFDFVNFDDDLYVYDNAQVTGGLSLKGLAWVFTHMDCHFYHPLTMLSLMVDYQLHGLHAGGYHLTNVLLHTGSVLLLFLVLQRMTGAIWRSAFVAALFAIHPLRAESVAWVAERKDVLATFFFMLTLGAYVHFVRKPDSVKRYAMVVAAFAAALLSKPTMVTLPFLFLILDYWPLQRFGTQRLRQLILEKIPLLALAVAASIVTVVAEGKEALPTLEEMSISTRVGHAIVSYALYLRQLIWPAGLVVFYPQPPHGYPVWTTALSIIVLVSITVTVLTFWRERPYLLIGWLWYVGTLTPMVGLVQVGKFAHADRMTYLPEIGICMAIVWLAADLGMKWHMSRTASFTFMGTIVAALAFCAWKQTACWKNDESLWKHTIECTPGNSLAELNLGSWLLDHHRADEAVTHLQLAAQIEPTLAYTHLDLGNALFTLGQKDEAVAQFHQALQINPAFTDAHNNLANALFQMGRADEAMSHFQQALQISPDNVNALNNLGDALRRQGKLDEAVSRFEQALRVKPNFAEVHYNLGLALRQQGKIDEAIAQFGKAVELEPDFARAWNDRGYLLSQRGALDEATKSLQQAVELKPDYAEAHFNLGTVCLQKGKVDDATKEYRKALQNRPDYMEANLNLGNILAQEGDYREALELFQKARQSAPSNPTILNSLAWLLATCPVTSLRDGPKAVALARQADAATGGNNPMILHTLAAALAESGQFEEAKLDIQKALDLVRTAKMHGMEERFGSELKRYQTGSPLP